MGMGKTIILHEDPEGYKFCYYVARLVLLLENYLDYYKQEDFYTGTSLSYYTHIQIIGNGYIFEIGENKTKEFILKFYIENKNDSFEAYINFNTRYSVKERSRIFKRFGNLLNILIISDFTSDISEILEMKKIIREISKTIPEVVKIYKYNEKD